MLSFFGERERERDSSGGVTKRPLVGEVSSLRSFLGEEREENEREENEINNQKGRKRKRGERKEN